MKAPYEPTLIPLFDLLSGARIIMRPYEEADALDFFAAVQDSRERLIPWDAWPQRYQTLADAQKSLAYFRADFILRREMEMGIWEKTTADFLGSIMLRPKDWQIPFFEIGYWLCTSAEGKGYMSEALHLLVDFAFTQIRANRVMLRIDERNQRSLAVAKRFGFINEGRLRNAEKALDGSLRNMVIMALTPSDYASQ